MRLLFFKKSLAWPRSSGHDVHCFGMMRALAEAGHEVGLVTEIASEPRAVDGADLSYQLTVTDAPDGASPHPPTLTRLQRKFCSYWGTNPSAMTFVREAAARRQADAVVAVGLDALPMLAAVKGCIRVWYAADEWALHHLSLLRVASPDTWKNLKPAVIKGLYERAFSSLVNRVWVVSERDRRATRWVMGARNVDVIPNGVDSDYFRPLELPEHSESCLFWGRLDFEPNIDALRWFGRAVWPLVKVERPTATFRVYGFHPTPEVTALGAEVGFQISADVPDIRQAIAQHQVVVLPFISGAGIKNKLLEAASMSRAIIASPTALNGVRYEKRALITAKSPADWRNQLFRLWDHPLERQRLGTHARQWVKEQHSWEHCAATAIAGLEQLSDRIITVANSTPPTTCPSGLNASNE